ncbi:barstar family protein [Streptomyces mirabilis]|uniref:barstar family protein n=1 Tax=Streptomyces mirabilis TaxID=68239 RepID=UPI0036BA9E70
MQNPKYAVAAYSNRGVGESIWALRKDATDELYADPLPPSRVRYDLLGCAPQGELAGAVERARTTGSAPLGGLSVRTLDATHTPVGEEWPLEYARVLGDRPCALDPTLRDITVEASAVPDTQAEHPQRPLLSAGHRLLGADGEPWGHCRDLVQVPGEFLEPADPPVRLLGCSPRGSLRDALEAGDEDLGHAHVLRLNRVGRTVGSVLEGEIIAWIPSAHGRGLVDLTLDPWSRRLPRAAREAWDVWWRERQSEPNSWARCSSQGREFWLDRAREGTNPYGPDPEPGTTYHLDGRHVTDAPAFHCALGEAVNGPGGYFGHDLSAVADCLRGGHGAEPPFTLVWHDTEVARTCLGVTPCRDRRPPTFEELLAFLTENGVDVRIA